MAARKAKKKNPARARARRGAPRPKRKATSRKVVARKRVKKAAPRTPARTRVAHPRRSAVDTLHREQVRLDANKELVLAFYRKMIGEKDPEAARAFMGETYTQHSPYAKDGFEGVAEFARTFKRDFPNHHYEVKRVIAEGEFVVLHLHGKAGPNPYGEAVVDIFRVRNGRVIEHWDVIQPLPEAYENPNTPF
jgi:predicted SnoaL-like aldol condensation-catalyzing enzyme